MFVKIRDNVYLGDWGEEKIEELIKENKINRVLSVGGGLMRLADIRRDDFEVFYLPIRLDRKSPTHIKDLACHTPKMMVQNGDVVLVLCESGKERSAYVVARMLCEMEGRSIYDILLEMKELIPDFDLGKAYF